MDAKDFEIQKLRQEIAKLKNRLIEACGQACLNCDDSEIKGEGVCTGCRIRKIEEEAQK